MKSIFDKEKKTQSEIYSPTPTIKLVKFYAFICTACTHNHHEFGEYDNVGYAYCEEEKSLSNLKCFPKCSAKSCESFDRRTPGYEDDYWNLLGGMDKFNFKDDLDSKIAHSILNFNERMGDYRIGRVY